MKRLILIILFATAGAGTAYACWKTKQCCKRDYMGNLQCIEKCDYEFCPFSHPIEIK